MKRVVFVTKLILLLVGMLIFAFEINPVKSTFTETIHIEADGSIYPSDAPIITYDNVTYTLTDNIVTSSDIGICVWRENTIIDGAGYTIQGLESICGICVFRRMNVTVRNIKITSFSVGIYLSGSSNNIIDGNNLINNRYGVWLGDSSNNIISNNSFVNCGLFVFNSYKNVVIDNLVNGKPLVYLEEVSSSIVEDAGQVVLVRCNQIWVMGLDLSNASVGIQLWQTNSTEIFGNNITNNSNGIWLAYSSNNYVGRNNIVNNNCGIQLYSSSNNHFYHNNFIDNAQQVRSDGYFWDDGYPPGGNYWSNYKGTDLYCGPYQNITGSDGIGDAPHVIDLNNIDRYPLMQPKEFLLTSTYNLTILSTVYGTTIPEPKTYTCLNGMRIVITAIPEKGFSLGYWILDGTNKGSANPIEILMDTNHVLRAYFIDDIPPEISDRIQYPPQEVQPHQEVRVWVNVTDFGTGIKNVTLWYSVDNGTTWEIVNMKAYPEIHKAIWGGTIPGYEYCTWVTYKIIAFDNAGNMAVKDNNGYDYQYHIIPEFSWNIELLIPVVLISVALILMKRKLQK